MATARGTATINFGSINSPTVSTSVDVAGQVGLVAGPGTQVEAWLRLEATAEHSVDEIIVQPPNVLAGSVISGQFTIYARAFDMTDYGTYLVDWIWVV